MVVSSHYAVLKQLFIVSTSPYSNGDFFCFETVTSVLLPCTITTAVIYGFLVLYLMCKMCYLLKKNPSALMTS